MSNSSQSETLLSAWKDGKVKQSILEFVRAVSTEGDPGFVPVPERVAVFDNDGTLWCEQPIPVQGEFALERVKQVANERPALREQQPFKAILEHDREAMAQFDKRAIVELLAATHTGMTPTEFDLIARRFIAHAKHPRFRRPFTALAYLPMLQLLSLLREHGFTTFIVSGGGVDFIRAFSEQLYGIPRHAVIGSSVQMRFTADNGHSRLTKLPELGVFDDREQKPVNLELHIGRRPIFAFGNSDGDLAMLRYVAAGAGRRMALLLRHDDAEREYAYDSDFRVSPLEEALPEAEERGWLVSMQRDFAQVFPADVSSAQR